MASVIHRLIIIGCAFWFALGYRLLAHHVSSVNLSNWTFEGYFMPMALCYFGMQLMRGALDSGQMASFPFSPRAALRYIAGVLLVLLCFGQLTYEFWSIVLGRSEPAYQNQIMNLHTIISTIVIKNTEAIRKAVSLCLVCC